MELYRDCGYTITNIDKILAAFEAAGTAEKIALYEEHQGLFMARRIPKPEKEVTHE